MQGRAQPRSRKEPRVWAYAICLWMLALTILHLGFDPFRLQPYEQGYEEIWVTRVDSGGRTYSFETRKDGGMQFTTGFWGRLMLDLPPDKHFSIEALDERREIVVPLIVFCIATFPALLALLRLVQTKLGLGFALSLLWFACFLFVHLTFDRWEAEPFQGGYGLLGRIEGRRLIGFFAVWLWPCLAALLRQLYVRFVK